MKKCPDCQNPVDNEAVFCDRCGYRLAPSPVPAAAQANEASPPQAVADAPATGIGKAPCPACGYLNPGGEKFCFNCGSQISQPAPAVQPVKPLAPPSPGSQSSRADSKFCPTCAHLNTIGETYCANCGFWLVGQYSNAVGAPSAGPAAGSEIQSPLSPQPIYETSVGIKAIGRLLSQATNTFIPLLPKNEILLGRRDPERKIYPDIDVSGQGSGSNSVSRLHARLIVQGVLVYLEDLNSTNGTYLNRQRLQAGQRHLLKNGDEIRLGGLILIYQSE